MPKKSTTRSAAQRNKPKVQKNIALVRPNANVETAELPAEVETEETQLEMESGVEETESVVNTKTATTTAAPSSTKAGATAVARPKATKAAAAEAEPLSNVAPAAETAPKGSASARLAARRQAAQKTQRSAPTLITAEHYAYVRKDLIYIAILAILMFATIIILHFVPGIGA